MSKRFSIGLVSAAAMIAAWEILAVCMASEQIMPGPWTTFKTTLALFTEKNFLAVVGSTVLRGLVGFGIALVLGLELGVVAGMNEKIELFLRPWIVFMRSVPVVAFILLALVWFKSGSVPVFIGFLTMFPMICTNVVEGMKNVDGEMVEMAKFYKVEKKRIVREIYIPAITPFAISGVSSAFGIGWRAVVIGEVLSQPEYGIGSMMHAAQSFLNVEALIAWTLIAILISFLFEKLMRWTESKFIKWK